MKPVFIVAVCGLGLIASGCVSKPAPVMASAALDEEAKNFAPEPGKANLYVHRSRKLAGDAILFPTSLDGRIAGSLAANTFQCLSVPPGEHELKITAAPRMPEWLAVEPSGAAKEYTGVSGLFAVEAGKNYFFEYRVSPRSLRAQSEEDGRKSVIHSRRVQNTAIFSAANSASISLTNSQVALYQVDEHYVGRAENLSIAPGERTLLVGCGFRGKALFGLPQWRYVSAALRLVLQADHHYRIEADIPQITPSQHQILIWIEDETTHSRIAQKEIDAITEAHDPPGAGGNFLFFGQHFF